MSTIKEAQDYMNQEKGLLDSISPKIAGISCKQLDFCNGAGKIPKSVTKQLDTFNGVGKLSISGISQLADSFSSKIPESAIKQFESIGFTNKQLVAFNNAIKMSDSGFSRSVAFASAICSTKLNSNIVKSLGVGTIKSIRQQQDFFAASSLSTSAAKDFCMPQIFRLVSSVDALGIVSSIPSLRPPSKTASMELFSKYTESVRRFKNDINWASVFDHTPSDFNLQDSEVDSWFDSAAEVVDDMAKQKWLPKEESVQASEKTSPTPKKVPFSQLPWYEKLVIFVTIAGELVNLTATVFDLVTDFSAKAVQPPAVYRELNENDKKIFTCQMDLFETVNTQLSLNECQD